MPKNCHTFERLRGAERPPPTGFFLTEPRPFSHHGGQCGSCTPVGPRVWCIPRGVPRVCRQGGVYLGVYIPGCTGVGIPGYIPPYHPGYISHTRVYTSHTTLGIPLIPGYMPPTTLGICHPMYHAGYVPPRVYEACRVYHPGYIRDNEAHRALNSLGELGGMRRRQLLHLC